MQIANKAVATHVAILVLGLVIGFFSGREYLKYEIRETFTAAARSFSTLGTGADQGSSESTSAGDSDSKPAVPSPIVVSLLKKDFREHDYSAGVDDAVTFELGVKNDSDKDIRAFDGTVKFTDLLDNEIISSNLAINDPIPAHGSITWDGELNYNQFIAEHQRFRGAEVKNMKTVFAPRKVLFSDGTQKTF